MKLKLTFTLLSILLIAACKKEEPQPGNTNSGYNSSCPGYIYISGFVTDSLTGLPVEGISVGPLVSLGKPYDISKSDGSYALKIYYNPCWKYAIAKPNQFELDLTKLATGQTHYMNPYVVDLTSTQEDDTAQANIQVIPYSELKVHITGNGTPLSIKDFAPNTSAVIDLGNTVDTIVSRRIYSNRSISIQFFAEGALYTTIPYTSQYGSSETIQISYP